MRTKTDILQDFSLFSVPTGGIGSWLTERTHDDIFARLGSIDENPLSAVQLNQLLVLGHEAPVSDALFRYYWLQAPDHHPYRVRELPGFSDSWLRSQQIVSLTHLQWGLYRLYTDALLYFGDVRTAFRHLRDLSPPRLHAFFASKRFDTQAITRRGPPIPMKSIAKDSRYLISEMACKSYGDLPGSQGDLRSALLQAYKAHVAAGSPAPTIRQLLQNQVPKEYEARQSEFIFSAEEVLAETVSSEADLFAKYDTIASKFSAARSAALDNTRYYLSMLNDLDVYVATSMREREDFRRMAETCDRIFSDQRLQAMNVRYFDPTLSAADGHEDKGLIECLMVKCAKMLVHCAGEKDSYGKDAEAAMALSLGKPVIFLCDQQKRGRFYRDVHPLSRLIEFETGIAVGAMVTDSPQDVSELIYRTLQNRMEYCLEQPRPGFLRLKEKLTNSVVRLQTNNRLLTETFWNHYHRDRERKARPTATGDMTADQILASPEVAALMAAATREASIEITTAKYGAADKFVDVRHLLNPRIHDGHLELQVCNENLGGDPLPYTPKQLQVEYRHLGSTLSKVVSEGQILLLP
jgi:hypothetical protein